MIFFKRKEIVVDCFTNINTVHEFFPIQESSKFLPDWWKNTPKYRLTNNAYNLFDQKTIKSCNGLIDTYKEGFMIPLWSDLLINVKDKIVNCVFADQKSSIESHPLEQWKTYADPNQVGHVKIINPWKIKTKSNIKFFFTKPYWNYKMLEDFSILSGTVSYKYQHSSHINMFINLEKDKNVIVGANSPIVHIMPLTENKVIFKNHLIDDKEFNSFSNKFTFGNSYNFTKRLLDKKEKKCPFGFGK